MLITVMTQIKRICRKTKCRYFFSCFITKILKIVCNLKYSKVNLNKNSMTVYITFYLDTYDWGHITEYDKRALVIKNSLLQ